VRGPVDPFGVDLRDRSLSRNNDFQITEALAIFGDCHLLLKCYRNPDQDLCRLSLDLRLCGIQKLLSKSLCNRSRFNLENASRLEFSRESTIVRGSSGDDDKKFLRDRHRKSHGQYLSISFTNLKTQSNIALSLYRSLCLFEQHEKQALIDSQSK
jgi:hypothetical protein